MHICVSMNTSKEMEAKPLCFIYYFTITCIFVYYCNYEEWYILDVLYLFVSQFLISVYKFID